MQDPRSMLGAPPPPGAGEPPSDAGEMITCPQCGATFPESEGIQGGAQAPPPMPSPAAPPMADRVRSRMGDKFGR